jgi:hypothetical protein
LLYVARWPRTFRLDNYAKAGIGIVVILVILRIVIMLLL